MGNKGTLEILLGNIEKDNFGEHGHLLSGNKGTLGFTFRKQGNMTPPWEGLKVSVFDLSKGLSYEKKLK